MAVDPAIRLWAVCLIFGSSSLLPRPFDDAKQIVWMIGSLVAALTVAWRVPSRRIGAVGWIGLLYLGIALASLGWTAVPASEGLVAWTSLCLWAVALWAMAQWPVGRIVHFLQTMAGALAVVVALRLWDESVSPAWRFASITPTFLWPIGHVTYAGDLCAVLAVVAVVAAWTAARWRARLVWTVVGALLLVGVGLTATRTSLVALGAAGVVLLWGWWPAGNRPSFIKGDRGAGRCSWWPAGNRPPLTKGGRGGFPFLRWSLVVLLGAGAVLLPSGLRNGQSLGRRMAETVTAFRQGDPIHATGSRSHFYRVTAQMIAQRPLTGWGLGHFRFVYPEYANRERYDWELSAQKWVMHPHNELLHQAVELGLPGLALFLAIGVGVGVAAVRALRRGSSGPLPPPLMAVAGLTAVAVSWMLSTNFLHPLSRAVTTALVALLMTRREPDPAATVAPGEPAAIMASGDPAATMSSGDSAVTMASGDPAATPPPGMEENAAVPPPLTKGGRGGFPLIRWGILVTVGMACLIQLAYHAGLYAVRQVDRNPAPRARLPWAKRAVAFAPGTFDAEFRLALTWLQLGDTTQATPVIDRLMMDYPHVPSARYAAGVLAFQRGDMSGARRHLTEAVDNDPMFELAKQLLQRLPPPVVP